MLSIKNLREICIFVFEMRRREREREGGREAARGTATHTNEKKITCLPNCKWSVDID